MNVINSSSNIDKSKQEILDEMNAIQGNMRKEIARLGVLAHKLRQLDSNW